jgi:hypothetical protein
MPDPIAKAETPPTRHDELVVTVLLRCLFQYVHAVLPPVVKCDEFVLLFAPIRRIFVSSSSCVAIYCVASSFVYAQCALVCADHSIFCPM